MRPVEYLAHHELLLANVTLHISGCKTVLQNTCFPPPFSFFLNFTKQIFPQYLTACISYAIESILGVGGGAGG